MRPDPTMHKLSPDYWHTLIRMSGLSQQGAARAIGIHPRRMRHILAGSCQPRYPEQYTMERLVQEITAENHRLAQQKSLDA